jgi:transposase
MTAIARLPDLDTLDFAALKALIVARREELLSHQEQPRSQEEQLAWRDAEIEQLKLLIAKLRRMQFGRKSEKLERQIEQLELKLDELEAGRAVNAASSQTTASGAPVATRAANPVRRSWPAHLPREERKILPRCVQTAASS